MSHEAALGLVSTPVFEGDSQVKLVTANTTFKDRDQTYSQLLGGNLPSKMEH